MTGICNNRHRSLTSASFEKFQLDASNVQNIIFG